jgi:hypothetical protein
VLIYLNTELQDKVLRIFHYALRTDGYLFLGPAEGVTRNSSLFQNVTGSIEFSKDATTVQRSRVSSSLRGSLVRVEISCLPTMRIHPASASTGSAAVSWRSTRLST